MHSPVHSHSSPFLVVATVVVPAAVPAVESLHLSDSLAPTQHLSCPKIVHERSVLLVHPLELLQSSLVVAVRTVPGDVSRVSADLALDLAAAEVLYTSVLSATLTWSTGAVELVVAGHSAVGAARVGLVESVQLGQLSHLLLFVDVLVVVDGLQQLADDALGLRHVVLVVPGDHHVGVVVLGDEVVVALALASSASASDHDLAVGLLLQLTMRRSARPDDESEEVVVGVLLDGEVDLHLTVRLRLNRLQNRVQLHHLVHDLSALLLVLLTHALSTCVCTVSHLVVLRRRRGRAIRVVRNALRIFFHRFDLVRQLLHSHAELYDL